VTTGITQRVLLLGPDDEDRRALHVLLDRLGTSVAAARDLDAARRHATSDGCDVVLATAELAPHARAYTGAPVIAIVQARDVASSLALLADGIDDVLGRPLDELALAVALRRAARSWRAPAATAVAAPALIGDGAAMRRLQATIRAVAPARTTVLITGESGTGKELVARAIHDGSPRRDRAFIAFNCAAIPESLVESELFGHVRGAFTDAVRDKPGLFEEASGGTLFLDEVGDLSASAQAKLLRVLQESEICRVGDRSPVRVDVRVVAATLRDLPAAVGAGAFREDLFFRLNVVPVQVPALRDRSEDIPELARFFATRQAVRLGRAITLSSAALELLVEQPWPGNVRELENVIERALVLAEAAEIDHAFLSTLLPARGTCHGRAESPTSDVLSIKKATRTLEAGLIRRALGVTRGNRTNAAKLLEISHRALLYKMKEYGIS
jgi:two-component system response regulator AtoC